ncbi:MAG: DUF2855 family protein [Halioglobus sp.]|nr:DUF2855 family protein [Halioglobus sp.]
MLLQVDRLALTSNNISYAGAGDTLGYWGFFPAEEGWGRIPAMGWADVIASAHPMIDPGERVWGFFPLSTHLKILADSTGAEQFRDASPHRAEYAQVYARFDRAAALPIYDPAREDRDSLLRGLFMTSWLVEDFLDVNDGFGAASCLVTSASSKTSIALASCLNRRGRLAAIGVTSPANVAFCESLGFYDSVISYDAVDGLDGQKPAVMVDMAGSASVIGELHRHFGDNMRYSCRVGATHYEEMGSVEGLPGAAPEFFFAPSHVETRSAELGAATLMARLGEDYVAFRSDSDRWLEIAYSRGPQAVERTYREVLAGNVPPQTGHIVSLWP